MLIGYTNLQSGWLAGLLVGWLAGWLAGCTSNQSLTQDWTNNIIRLAGESVVLRVRVCMVHGSTKSCEVRVLHRLCKIFL